MKIYKLKFHQFIEKEVLDKETRESYFYIDAKDRVRPMRKHSSFEDWFKSPKECVYHALEQLKEKREAIKEQLFDLNKKIEEFEEEFKNFLI
jgi:hypothetical protein